MNILDKAFNLGQQYWMQSDSESTTQWKKADATLEKFRELKLASLLSFQNRVKPWLLECFGKTIAADVIERNHRFLEESLELVQACGCTKDEAHSLVEYVYNRSVGEINQETGGVMVTLAALCIAQNVNMHDAGEIELNRVLQPDITNKIRLKNANKPNHSPLPVSVKRSRDLCGND